jgi:cytochrome c553
MKETLSRAGRPLTLLAALLSGALSAQAQEALPTGHPEAAKTKIALCLGCHGIEGYRSSFPEVHRVPKIAGQNEGYIAAALQAYRKGDRKHPTMGSVAASLSDQDIADLAAYYAVLGQPAPGAGGQAPAVTGVSAPSPEVQALLTKGNCATCHGEGLNKPIAPNYPKLAGQYPDYLFVALKAYQTEHNGLIGRNNAIMAPQARMFTHPELKLLADYIGQLPGNLKTVPESRFR